MDVECKKNNLIEKAARIKLVVFDFDGVFTDNRVLVFENGQEAVFCNRSDGLGIKLLKEAGINTWVISTEVNPVVGARCKKLRLPYIQNCPNKLDALKGIAAQLKISLEEVAYLGNDINDLECLKNVGFPACVADAYDEIKDSVIYITKSLGGKGAVREFCNFILKARDEKH